MQTTMRLATIESVFDRFGGYHPIFVGELPQFPHLGFADGILSPSFREDEFKPSPYLQQGDLVGGFIPDGSLSYAETGISPTMTVDQVLTTSIPFQGSVKCPECASLMSLNQRYWCENPLCRGRFIGRICHMSSAEGLKYPWFVDKNVTEHFLHHMQFRTMAQMFDPVEISIADGDVLPQHVVGEIVGWLLNFRSSYQSGSEQAKKLILASLIAALSYPGLDVISSVAFVENAFRLDRFSPCRLICAGFININVLGSLLNLAPGIHQPLLRHMVTQLHPFHKEICRLLDWLSDEALSL